jgi:hypothetical protein
LVSLLFPVVRDVFVELHYVPALRIGPQGVFVTTKATIRKMPDQPVSLTVLNPLNIAQRDATIEGSDPRTGLILLKAPFAGPVFPIAKRNPRLGEAVLLSGSPPRKMSHMVPVEHRVPDLRAIRAEGRITGEGEATRTGGPTVSAGWAVLDAEGRTLLGVIVTSNGDRATYVSAGKVRRFLKASGVPAP